MEWTADHSGPGGRPPGWPIHPAKPQIQHLCHQKQPLSSPGQPRRSGGAELASVLAVLDSPKARSLAAGRVARRNVLAAYRDLAEKCHDQRNPLLFEALAAANALLDRWSAAPIREEAKTP